MAEVSGDFLAMLVFFYAMHCLHELGPAELVAWPEPTLAEVPRAAEGFCAMEWEVLLEDHSVSLSDALCTSTFCSVHVCVCRYFCCVSCSQISYVPNVSVSRASHSGCLRVPILVSFTCFRPRARLVCRLLETIGSPCPCLETLLDIVFGFVLTLRFLPAIPPVSGASRKSKKKNIRGIYSTLSIYCVFRCFTSVHTPHHFVTATVGWDLQANHVARGPRPPLRGGRVHDDSPPRRLRLPGTF